jgi:carboxyl-terminal processing protease
MRRLFITILLSCLFLFSFAQQNSEDEYFEILKNLEIYNNILLRLQNDYVYPVNFSQLITTSINSMLKDLDPYTIYYPENQIQKYRLITEAKYVGIGITLKKLDTNIYITEIFPNSPAQKRGLRIGDKILKVNDIPISDKNLKQIHDFLIQ